MKSKQPPSQKSILPFASLGHKLHPIPRRRNAPDRWRLSGALHKSLHTYLYIHDTLLNTPRRPHTDQDKSEQRPLK